MDAEALQIIDWIIEGMDLEFATVTRASTSPVVNTGARKVKLS